ncbi:hypothetical protein [Flavobacterium aquatile]|uniref:Rad50/SbcC-type AAA domain-containing protein n=1 Tax=Flavobacterium aquatile LMG 4008 = ATCC 11947 TaxID=1453498 RepID=A0A095SQS3_9FLAO|nr:hypothetical protein [Flavobacterium aquatile]KGD66937.1 hypothetical protein LG45_16070 [Flavobacterium aquatile LMG 4008 = ATCC 11947]OXA68031.1 hypothetical protein B0A61_06065 [Flavobacterium aquatile LMG 4008 = ATCC 11947]GEC80152.1 hypothetical protein FAQ01_30220 [Flavobacterium aquatile]
MTKRIVSLAINNCRAYCSRYDALTLPNGENVLIYGENGSGKSSLYKAMNNYFAKSTKLALPFVKNRYLSHLDGEIKITFSEFSNTPFQLLPGTEEEYTFGSVTSDNNIEFIQTASLVKGFLDYTDLLKVYLHKEERPNLFDLIVFSLLGNHIPLASGGNFKFKEKWDQLQNDLTVRAYTRNDRCHKNAAIELPNYEIHLRSTLDSVFNELNRLLNLYFTDFNIQLNYVLLPLDFNYENYKVDWYTTADLRLDIIKDGVSILGDYSDFLNEARLSAIAICLYLASLLQNPTNVDLKILFLDDVFIGLDAGNRIPILNILRAEFSGFQKFISTYDRHWFELAKRQFEIHDDKSWSTLEIYVGTETVNHNLISKPILVKGATNYEKAVQYLHDKVRPDYPAATNYFRKSVEELIQDLVPEYELVDADNTQIADYKLTLLLSKTKNFLEKINADVTDITAIIGLLHNLIHPLSHHEITSPIYKNELLILENAIPNLRQLLINLDISNNYRCVLEHGKSIRITMTVNSAVNHFTYYELKLKESVILSRNGGAPSLSNSKCFTERCHGTNNGVPIPSFSPSKSDARFNYNSLESASESIYNFLQANGPAFVKGVNYLNGIEYHNGTNWVSIIPLTVW